jgi:flagellar basal body-associated protein FliL
MSNGKSMLIVFGVFMLVIIGVMVGAVFYISTLIGKSGGQSADGAPPPMQQQMQLAVDQISIFSLQNPISVNLLDGGDGVQHVIRLNVSIGVNNTDAKASPALLTTLANSEVIIRDAVNTILRNKTIQEVSAEEDGQAAIKQEILEKMQDIYKTPLIHEVYIGEIYYN